MKFARQVFAAVRILLETWQRWWRDRQTLMTMCERSNFFAKAQRRCGGGGAGQVGHLQ
jgi:hypothetical protein